MAYGDYEKLQEAVRELYYAAYWEADRVLLNEHKLWENVRDAAGLMPGQTKDILGEPRTQPHFTHGIIVNRPSFVVDDSGRHWWIDPHMKEIERII